MIDNNKQRVIHPLTLAGRNFFMPQHILQINLLQCHSRVKKFFINEDIKMCYLVEAVESS